MQNEKYEFLKNHKKNSVTKVENSVTKVDKKSKSQVITNFENFGGYIFCYESGFFRYKSGTTVIIFNSYYKY